MLRSRILCRKFRVAESLSHWGVLTYALWSASVLVEGGVGGWGWGAEDYYIVDFFQFICQIH